MSGKGIGMRASMILLVLLFLPSACLKFERAGFPDKQSFMTEVSRPGAPVSNSSPVRLKIKGLRISPEFQGKNFVYRTGPMTYESDFYNEFFISPAAMLTRNIRQWLQDSGLFQTVSDYSGFMDTPYVLHGEVSALYGDFSKKTSPEAVLEIVFVIFDTSAPETRIVFQNQYHETHAFVDGKPGDLVTAWNHCLKQILTSFEDDLSREWISKLIKHSAQ